MHKKFPNHLKNFTDPSKNFPDIPLYSLTKLKMAIFILTLHDRTNPVKFALVQISEQNYLNKSDTLNLSNYRGIRTTGPLEMNKILVRGQQFIMKCLVDQGSSLKYLRLEGKVVQLQGYWLVQGGGGSAVSVRAP